MLGEDELDNNRVSDPGFSHYLMFTDHKLILLYEEDRKSLVVT